MQHCIIEIDKSNYMSNSSEHFLGEDRGQETRRPEKGQLSGDNERMCRRRRRRRFVDFDAAPVRNS